MDWKKIDAVIKSKKSLVLLYLINDNHYIRDIIKKDNSFYHGNTHNIVYNLINLGLITKEKRGRKLYLEYTIKGYEVYKHLKLFFNAISIKYEVKENE